MLKQAPYIKIMNRSFGLLTSTCFLTLLICFNIYAFENTNGKTDSAATQARIITLSPHLTELVYALGKGEHVIAVSDFSDFPKHASKHPSVASFEGANIADIIRLKPTHILVWRGGNKDADIQKLRLLGFQIFESNINSPQDLLAEITAIGTFLSTPLSAQKLRADTLDKMKHLQNIYSKRALTTVYYLNQHPLSGLGNDNWLNKLLNLCNINNIYETSLAAYPQLQIADVIRQQPALIIAADGSNIEQATSYWQAHKDYLNAKLVLANPDALHRFTARAIEELVKVCERAYN